MIKYDLEREREGESEGGMKYNTGPAYFIFRTL